MQIINAYEFEQHAGCKTKHPNNHIYFESGKTIYAVVLELRKTPPEMLLEKILTAAGSPVNENNFLAWKGIVTTLELPATRLKKRFQQLMLFFCI